MRPRDIVDLVLLAALWGASFLFMRFAAPAFGPIALVEVRVAVASAFLLPLLRLRGGMPALRAHAAPIALIGVMNSAIPFALFTFAALYLTAGFASILNATVPMWTALIAWLWLRDRIRPAQWLGLAIGIAGVVILVWGKVELKPGSSQWSVTLAIGAILIATLLYGITPNYMKRSLTGVNSMAVAAGSQLSAAIVLLPFAIWLWPAQPIDALTWGAAIALGIGCSGLAYILYFRLIANVGPLRAASVTFLIPLFGVLWGALFLDEAVSLQMVLGGATILVGTALALGLVAPRVAATAATR